MQELKDHNVENSTHEGEDSSSQQLQLQQQPLASSSTKALDDQLASLRPVSPLVVKKNDKSQELESPNVWNTSFNPNDVTPLSVQQTAPTSNTTSNLTTNSHNNNHENSTTNDRLASASRRKPIRRVPVSPIPNTFTFASPTTQPSALENDNSNNKNIDNINDDGMKNEHGRLQLDHNLVLDSKKSRRISLALFETDEAASSSNPYLHPHHIPTSINSSSTPPRPMTPSSIASNAGTPNSITPTSRRGNIRRQHVSSMLIDDDPVVSKPKQASNSLSIEGKEVLGKETEKKLAKDLEKVIPKSSSMLENNTIATEKAPTLVVTNTSNENIKHIEPPSLPEKSIENFKVAAPEILPLLSSHIPADSGNGLKKGGIRVVNNQTAPLLSSSPPPLQPSVPVPAPEQSNVVSKASMDSLKASLAPVIPCSSPKPSTSPSMPSSSSSNSIPPHADKVSTSSSAKPHPVRRAVHRDNQSRLAASLLSAGLENDPFAQAGILSPPAKAGIETKKQERNAPEVGKPEVIKNESITEEKDGEKSLSEQKEENEPYKQEIKASLHRHAVSNASFDFVVKNKRTYEVHGENERVEGVEEKEGDNEGNQSDTSLPRSSSSTRDTNNNANISSNTSSNPVTPPPIIKTPPSFQPPSVTQAPPIIQPQPVRQPFAFHDPSLPPTFQDVTSVPAIPPIPSSYHSQTPQHYQTPPPSTTTPSSHQPATLSSQTPTLSVKRSQTSASYSPQRYHSRSSSSNSTQSNALKPLSSAPVNYQQNQHQQAYNHSHGHGHNPSSSGSASLGRKISSSSFSSPMYSQKQPHQQHQPRFSMSSTNTAFANFGTANKEGQTPFSQQQQQQNVNSPKYHNRLNSTTSSTSRVSRSSTSDSANPLHTTTSHSIPSHSKNSGSFYVRELKRRAATLWCDIPPSVWGLPIGLVDTTHLSLHAMANGTYTAGPPTASSSSSGGGSSSGSGSGIKGVKSSVDIRHSHLTPRLLASDVGEDDFAVMGPSNTNSNIDRNNSSGASGYPPSSGLFKSSTLQDTDANEYHSELGSGGVTGGSGGATGVDIGRYGSTASAASGASGLSARSGRSRRSNLSSTSRNNDTEDVLGSGSGAGAASGSGLAGLAASGSGPGPGSSAAEKDSDSVSIDSVGDGVGKIKLFVMNPDSESSSDSE